MSSSKTEMCENQLLNKMSFYKGIGFFILLFILSTSLTLITKLSLIVIVLTLINILIFYEINKFIINLKNKLFTLLIINLANVMHIMGGIITLLGLRKLFERKINVLSRSNK